MLDIKFIREHTQLVKDAVKNRKVTANIDHLLSLDDQRKDLIAKVENLRAKRNRIADKLKNGKDDELIAASRNLKDELGKFELELEEIEQQWQEEMQRVPNIIHPSSPKGGEQDFKLVGESGHPPKFSFHPKDHEQLMTELGLIDFERGAKVAGAKFYFTKNELVKLNKALISYGIDVATKAGFELIETPDLAKTEIMSGTGYNPRGNEAQVYTITGDDLSLIATSEITIGGYHSDEVLDLTKGPKKYVALSHCFRREGGAYGRTSKGLYRVHQFEKLELFVFCKPEDSEKMHQEILALERKICEGLEIPYRVIDIASEDLGAPAYRKYDVEAWMVMVGEKGGYGEITSTSNCTDYQARRLNIKYRKPDGTNAYVHTLNGTAIALTRLPIAIFENYQQEDGSIVVPKVLQKYTGFDVIKKKE